MSRGRFPSCRLPFFRGWRAARRAALLLTAALTAAGCEGGGSPGDDPPPIDAGPDRPFIPSPALTPGPQTPPMGQTDIEAWLAAGHYKSWQCETAIFPRRLNGAHGRHRICTNELLIGSSSGPYPIGAASVKELYESMDLPNGYAVGLKVREGPGHDTWYWYERTGRLATLVPLADGIGVPVCGSACHGNAIRDNVFIRADGK